VVSGKYVVSSKEVTRAISGPELGIKGAPLLSLDMTPYKKKRSLCFNLTFMVKYIISQLL